MTQVSWLSNYMIAIESIDPKRTTYLIINNLEAVIGTKRFLT